MISWLKNLFSNRNFGAVRSPKWPEVEKDFKILHPLCEVCGTKGTLLNQINIHHCVPFHKDISKELDFDNLWTLCRQHHFLFGHLMSWKSWNVNVREDSANFRNKITNRP
jgi:5-methylcytosine-specific restriction protein A